MTSPGVVANAQMRRRGGRRRRGLRIDARRELGIESVLDSSTSGVTTTAPSRVPNRGRVTRRRARARGGVRVRLRRRNRRIRWRRLRAATPSPRRRATRPNAPSSPNSRMKTTDSSSRVRRGGDARGFAPARSAKLRSRRRGRRGRRGGDTDVAYQPLPSGSNPGVSRDGRPGRSRADVRGDGERAAGVGETRTRPKTCGASRRRDAGHRTRERTVHDGRVRRADDGGGTRARRTRRVAMARRSRRSRDERRAQGFVSRAPRGPDDVAAATADVRVVGELAPSGGSGDHAATSQSRSRSHSRCKAREASGRGFWLAASAGAMSCRPSTSTDEC